MTIERLTVGKTIDTDIPYLAVNTSDIQTELKIYKSVTYAINGGYIDWEGRLRETINSKKILLDGV